MGSGCSLVGRLSSNPVGMDAGDWLHVKPEFLLETAGIFGLVRAPQSFGELPGNVGYDRIIPEVDGVYCDGIEGDSRDMFSQLSMGAV